MSELEPTWNVMIVLPGYNVLLEGLSEDDWSGLEEELKHFHAGICSPPHIGEWHQDRIRRTWPWDKVSIIEATRNTPKPRFVPSAEGELLIQANADAEERKRERERLT